MKRILIEPINSKPAAVLALKNRKKIVDRKERLAIIQKAAQFVPLLAKHAQEQDKKADLI